MNDLEPPISFGDAMNETQFWGNRTVLLGNGFSIAQAGSFVYSNLLKESSIDQNSSLGNVFCKFGTVDFEKIIQSLEIAAKVAQAYSQKYLTEQYQAAAKEVRNQLIGAIKKVHPRDFRSIPEQEIKNCVHFLKSFGKVFTLNYDLLLYWVLISSDAFIDGFGYGKRKDPFFGPFNREAFKMAGKGFFYNIHGGLHLFQWPDRDVYKAIASRGDNLLDSITNIIGQHPELPLYVAEGTFEQKLDKIRSVPYLNYCFEELQGLSSGSLFIFGHSGNRTDEHIYDAIFKSKIKALYYCFYNEAQLPQVRGLFEECRTKHKNYIPIKYIDVGQMNVWRP